MLTNDQPRPAPSPSIRSNAQAYISPSDTIRTRIVRLQRKITTRHGWFGDYDYSWLCTPTLPFVLPGRQPKRFRGPPFYALDADLPILLAITTGLQHALAMLAGLITPPIIFASALNLDATISSYMISASLIGCGKSCHGSRCKKRLTAMYRNSELCSDVPYQALQKLLFRYRAYLRGGN